MSTTHGSPRGHGALPHGAREVERGCSLAHDADLCEELADDQVHPARARLHRGTHHARLSAMMKTVKHTFTSIGDHSGDLARTIGSGTAGLARRVGGGTAGLARRIGPRRAIIGLAVAAVAIGGSIVVIRYLRARRADGLATDGTGDASGRSGNPPRSRAKHPADAAVAHQS